ncbi:Glycosyl transferase [Aduncisulcus paluster]|uniref:Glycosyl transferase n=1 Tax=Aduncisulcus paluster TaxID=2918883 RepID=A0ABQ5K7B7_9EUKA|nr:Glycosyl transferase [Aduncisulcus paluster]
MSDRFLQSSRRKEIDDPYFKSHTYVKEYASTKKGFSEKKSKVTPGGNSIDMMTTPIQDPEEYSPPPFRQIDSKISDEYKQDLFYDAYWQTARLFFERVNLTAQAQQKLLKQNYSAYWTHLTWLFLCGLVVGFLVFYLWLRHLIIPILEFTTYGFFVFFTLEYILAIIALNNAQYPSAPPLPEKILPPGKVGFLIAVGWGTSGLSEEQRVKARDEKLDVLIDTIKAAQKIVPTCDIYIIHNSADPTVVPDDKFESTLCGQCIYCPLQLPGKSVAVLFGSVLLKHLQYSHVVVLDDDTRVPAEMLADFSRPLLAAAYAPTIRAQLEDEETATMGQKLLVGLQDIEYKLSDLQKLAQDQWTSRSSVLAPHGAVNVWRSDVLVKIMKDHNGVFDGEDYQMGKLLRINYPDQRLRVMSSAPVCTVAPSDWGTLFRQRKNSWDLASHQMMCGGLCASQDTAFFWHVLCCSACSERSGMDSGLDKQSMINATQVASQTTAQMVQQVHDSTAAAVEYAAMRGTSPKSLALIAAQTASHATAIYQKESIKVPLLDDTPDNEPGDSGFMDTFLIRIVTLMDIWISIQDYIRFPILSLYIMTAFREKKVNILVSVLFVITFVSQTLLALVLNFVKLRDKPKYRMKSNSLAIFTAIILPFYRFILSFIRVLSLLRFFVKYDAISRSSVPFKQLHLDFPARDPAIFGKVDELEKLGTFEAEQSTITKAASSEMASQLSAHSASVRSRYIPSLSVSTDSCRMSKDISDSASFSRLLHSIHLRSTHMEMDSTSSSSSSSSMENSAILSTMEDVRGAMAQIRKRREKKQLKMGSGKKL